MAFPIFPILLILGLGAAAAASGSTRRRQGGGASSGGGTAPNGEPGGELPPWEDWGISDAIVPMTPEEEEQLLDWQQLVAFIQEGSRTVAIQETLRYIDDQPDAFADLVPGEPYKQGGKWHAGVITRVPITEGRRMQIAERIGAAAAEKAAAAMINQGDSAPADRVFEALRRAYVLEIWADPRVVDALAPYPDARGPLKARVGSRLVRELQTLVSEN